MAALLSLLFFLAAIYGLAVAYRRYLLFPHPVARVVLSQVIVSLAELVVVVVTVIIIYG
jgi:hypothetical protein